MKALVVYESLFGNTAAVAKAVAEGIGAGTPAVTTDAVPDKLLAEADLVVAGAPVIGFSLASDGTLANVANTEAGAPTPPDASHPSMRSWLERLPATTRAVGAAFETRIWWSPRGATGDIEDRLRRAGYRTLAKAGKFVVKDKYGPLREGELDRAREWGRSLASAIAS